jgi:hypothetical protein
MSALRLAILVLFETVNGWADPLAVMNLTAEPEPVFVSDAVAPSLLDRPRMNAPPVAAYAVPPSATNNARYATTVAWRGRLR